METYKCHIYNENMHKRAGIFIMPLLEIATNNYLSKMH